ncbi:MAG TPA: hypothetical protein VMW38_25130, partial [Terriglobia bacterium]|nr:hypothetical protein [Terriglobia bacterium]
MTDAQTMLKLAERLRQSANHDRIQELKMVMRRIATQLERCSAVTNHESPVEIERADAMNAGLNQEAFRQAWQAFQNTPIDLVADSDDETCKCLSNAIRTFVRAVHTAKEAHTNEYLMGYAIGLHDGKVAFCAAPQPADSAPAAWVEAKKEIDAGWPDIAPAEYEIAPNKVTLWRILRKHGIPLDRAQWVCNEALNAGVIGIPPTPA